MPWSCKAIIYINIIKVIYLFIYHYWAGSTADMLRKKKKNYNYKDKFSYVITKLRYIQWVQSSWKSQNLYYHIYKVVGYSNLWLNVSSNFVSMKKYGSLVEQNGKGDRVWWIFPLWWNVVELKENKAIPIWSNVAWAKLF